MPFPDLIALVAAVDWDWMVETDVVAVVVVAAAAPAGTFDEDDRTKKQDFDHNRLAFDLDDRTKKQDFDHSRLANSVVWSRRRWWVP